MLLDCVIYCAFYSILFRGAVFSGHGVVTFCSRTHRLATILHVTDDRRRRTDDGRNTVPIARPLVRLAKNASVAARLQKSAVMFSGFLLESSLQPVDHLAIGIPAVLGRHQTTWATQTVCNTCTARDV